MLYGAKAILGYLHERHGLRITRYTLWRFAQRNRHRFPIFKAKMTAGEAGRPRLSAHEDDVDKWMRASYGSRPVVPHDSLT